MRVAPDVSSHSSGAFPSEGFKPSYLAGLNSPAFFITRAGKRFVVLGRAKQTGGLASKSAALWLLKMIS